MAAKRQICYIKSIFRYKDTHYVHVDHSWILILFLQNLKPAFVKLLQLIVCVQGQFL